MNAFEPSTNQVAGVFKLAFVICLSLVAKTAGACGDGSSTSVAAYDELRCCSVSHGATGYEYSVDGGTHDDNIKFTVENDEGTVILDTGGNCDITQSGTRCSGTACTSEYNNNCQRGPISGIEAQKICVVMECENSWSTCNVDAFSVTFYKAGGSSPPPPSPPPPSDGGSSSPPPPTSASPPPEQTESADTSQNCKCSCCRGNYCSASIVASYNAESSSECGSADCRSRFSTLCPASGESGSVSASYSKSSSGSDGTTSSPTTDTTPSPTSPGSLTSPKFLTLIASALTVIWANP